jgi:Fur family ferric uptake transcriptional regulator
MNESYKFRGTKARRVMVDEICKVCSHPTADEVYALVRKRLPRISLGTIYRNLELLSGKGLIQKLDSAGTQRRYDGNTENHYHLRCLACGLVKDILIRPLNEWERLLPQDTGYEILGHRLEFFGICPSCKLEKKNGQVDPAGLERGFFNKKERRINHGIKRLKN